MLLRIAVGWHFAAEGIYKIMSTPEAKNSVLAKIFEVTEGPTFTSEDYLRNSSGPFAERFRAMVPDADSRYKLDAERVKNAWTEEMHRVGNHYGFVGEQQDLAAKALVAKEKVIDAYLTDPETIKKIKTYFDDLSATAAVERNRDALAYERIRATDTRRKAETERKELVKPILGWEKELRDGWVALSSKEQAEREGAYVPPLDELGKVDRLTMYGTTAIGFALMLGFLTPVAGLGGALFLALIYFSMPPFPGLPVSPKSEGHYVYVNKNLVELFAMLVIASTPSGLWFGVDAFLFGWINRIGKRAEIERESSPDLSDAAVSKARRLKKR